MNYVSILYVSHAVSFFSLITSPLCGKNVVGTKNWEKKSVCGRGCVGWCWLGCHYYLFSAESEGRWGIAITLATDLHRVPLLDQALRRILPHLDIECWVWDRQTDTHKEIVNGGPFRNTLPRQCGFSTNHSVKNNKEGTFWSRVSSYLIMEKSLCEKSKFSCSDLSIVRVVLEPVCV